MLTLLFTTTDQLPTTYCLLLVVTHLLRSGGETRTDHWERSGEHAICSEEESQKAERNTDLRQAEYRAVDQ